MTAGLQSDADCVVKTQATCSLVSSVNGLSRTRHCRGMLLLLQRARV